MKRFRIARQQFFERFGEWGYNHPLLMILGTALIAGVLFSQLPKLYYDGSIEGFLHETDSTLHAFNDFRHQFGQDGEVIIALKPKTIFDIHFFKTLKALHLALERNVPHLEDITSMLNARYVEGRNSLFTVEDLLLQFPKTDLEMTAFKARVMNNRIYRDLLISNDGKYTTISIRPNRYAAQVADKPDLMSGFMDNTKALTIGQNISERKFLTQEETYAFVNAIERTVDAYRSEDLQIYVSGSPVVSNRIVAMMQKEMPLFTKLCVLFLCIALFFITRRISLVVLPILIIIITLLSTFGLMAATGKAIKPPTQVLLSILIVAGMCDSIHLLSIFVKHLNQAEPKKTAIIKAVGHCGTPCLMTTLTTAAGMLSFTSSALSPVSDLGVFGAAGTCLALFYTLALIPAVISFLPLKPGKRAASSSTSSAIELAASRMAMVGYRHPLKVVAAVIVLLMIAAGGMTQLRFFHNALLWLPENMAIRKDTEKIDSVFNGSVNLEVVLDTGKQGGVQDHDFISRLDQMTREIKTYQTHAVTIGKAIAVSDVLCEINQALNQNDPAFYEIPSPASVSQQFMLFENSGSEDLEDFTDSLYRKARVTVRVPWMEAKTYTSFIAGIKNGFVKTFGQLAEVTTTGMMTILNRTSQAVMQSMAYSYLFSVFTITALMMLLLRDAKAGGLSIMPNFIPVLLILGLMGYQDMPLDTFSMLVGSIALGLLVDDTVHYFHNFKKHYDRTKDVQLSIEMTTRVVSRPVIITSIVLASGFWVYTRSQLSNVADFGSIMTIVILLGLLIDLIFTPALFTLMHHHSIRRATDSPKVSIGLSSAIKDGTYCHGSYQRSK